MDFFILLLSILLACLSLFLVIRPKKQVKTSEQKKEEIKLHYEQTLIESLKTIENPEERQKHKIILLKHFAKELEFNLFFDKEETHALIKKLASY